MRRLIQAVLCVLLLAACTPGHAKSGAAAGTVTVAGSSSVAPLMRQLKAGYEAVTGIAVEVQESGSTSGITATLEGAADLGMSSRDLSESERAAGLRETVIALDGIAVIVHPASPVRDLTLEQVRAVFSGAVTDWAEVGGNPGEIFVVSREDGSGTRGAFEELTGLQEEVERDGKTYRASLISRDALYENSTGGVKAHVAGSVNAVGYLSLGTVDGSVAAISVGGVPCAGETIVDGSYAIARPFLLCAPGEGGQAQGLIDYILSADGRNIIRDAGYIPWGEETP